MKFLYNFPGRTVPAIRELLAADALSTLAATAEEVGFSAVGLDDHPAPTRRWRDEPAGHDTLDPFVGLAAVAAATTRVRLVTHAAVLGYRNPFLLAKVATTLDVLSRGRLTLGVVVGYLEGEFRALGVDFARRNEYFDEALAVLVRAWQGEPVTHVTERFVAEDNVVQPAGLQPSSPPIWVGGNSATSLRRAAAFGECWMALPNSPSIGVSRRSPYLESVHDLRTYVARLGEYAEAVGRSQPVDVLYTYRATHGGVPRSEQIAELADAGVTWLTITGTGTSVDEAREELLRLGEKVIGPCA